MIIPFHKFHGTGNDFILIDNREDNIRLPGEQIARLCNRHFGIGADGLMLLTSRSGYDFGMEYYNSDGKESTMCGNGGRCITAFARQLGIIDKNTRFVAIDGEHVSEIQREEGNVMQVNLRMADVAASSVREVRNAKSEMRNVKCEFLIDTGSPHFVLFVEDAIPIDVMTEGRKLRNDTQFTHGGGVNVDFVQVREDGSLFVRTYERGVENETLSCGTGVTAAAVAYARMQSAVCSPQSAVRNPQSAVCSPQSAVRSSRSAVCSPQSAVRSSRSPVTDNGSRITNQRIETPGGRLTVSFRQEENLFTDIWLEGPAEFVFSGEI